MKKIISIVCIIAILTAVFVFAGCGDKKNEEVKPTEVVATEAPATEAPTEAPAVVQSKKQSTYEALLKDTSKIDLTSNNMSISSSGSGVLTEVLMSSNGDVKLSMKLAEEAYYIAYSISNETYMEMHVPDFIMADEEGNEITVPAEVFYYKTTGMNSYNPAIMSPISDVEDVLKDFKSIKYIETKEINGVKCDVVEATKEFTAKEYENNSSFGNSSTPSPSEGPSKVVYNLYFTETGNKFYGCSVTDKGVTTTLYCVNSVDIKLPEKDFKKVDAMVIEENISNMLMGASQSGTPIDPTE
jgi:hypothetical protein